jgi:hypothetical protein
MALGAAMAALKQDPSFMASTLEQQQIVIPLRVSTSEPEEAKLSQTVRVRYHSFPYELGFAITYHKVQGQTLRKAILDLRKPCSASLKLQSLYVGISRVQQSDHMRILPLDVDVTHLTKLEHPECLKKWYRQLQSNRH